MDDFLTKKKEVAPILDLYRATANSSEEFKKLLEILPEFKIKPEKVRGEDLKIKDKGFKFRAGKKDMKILKQSYTFMDPLPLEMKDLNIEELANVPIEWKMLTTIRPKTKTEEEFFSRLVELRKLAMKTAAKDRRSYGMDPQIRKTKNKSGVVETRVVSCKECNDEFCTGEWCTLFSYDNFVRVPGEVTQVPLKAEGVDFLKGVGKSKKKVKRRSRSLTKSSRSKSRKKSKSKSSEKPTKISPKSRAKSAIKSPKKAKSPKKTTPPPPPKTSSSVKKTGKKSSKVKK